MIMFKFAQKGMVRYLESEALNACGFLTHAFLTRWNGASEGTFSSLNFSVREGDEEDRVARNWEILAGAFQISPSQFFMISQIHGDRIFVVDGLMDKDPSPLPLQCDAVLTASKRVVIGIKTADCVPILLADRVRQVIGAVHAGWRGTAREYCREVHSGHGRAILFTAGGYSGGDRSGRGTLLLSGG